MKQIHLVRYSALIPFVFLQVCSAQLPTGKIKIINNNFVNIKINPDVLVNAIKDVKLKGLAQKNKVVIQAQDPGKKVPPLDKPPVADLADPRTPFLNSLQLITDRVLPPANTPLYMVANPYVDGVLQPRSKWIFMTYIGTWYGESRSQGQHVQFRATTDVCFIEPVQLKQISWNNFEMDFPPIEKGSKNKHFATEYRQTSPRGFGDVFGHPAGPWQVRILFVDNNGKKGFVFVWNDDRKYITAPYENIGCGDDNPYMCCAVRYSNDVSDGNCNWAYTRNLLRHLNPVNPRDFSGNREVVGELDSAHGFFNYQLLHGARVKRGAIYFATSTAPWPAYCTMDKMDNDRDSYVNRNYGGFDCNDADNTVFPNLDANDACDERGVDSDCYTDISLYFRDEDGDGYYSEQCFEVSTCYNDMSLWGKVIRGTDCDDHNPSIIPGRVMYTDDNTYFICGNYDTYGRRIQITVEPGFRCVRQPDGSALILPR